MKKISFAWFALLPLALVACSSESGQDEGSTSDEVGKFVADSTYTNNHDDTNCKVTETGPEDEEPWQVEECNGTGEFRTRIFSGDLREYVTILGPNGSEYDIPMMASVPEGYGWSYIGPKTEWRTPRGQAQKPYAQILRHIYELPQDDGITTKKQHYLAVTKLNGAAPCLYGIVEASKASGTANQTARDLADAARLAPECPQTVEITRK
jgi:hypothetical protein